MKTRIKDLCILAGVFMTLIALSALDLEPAALLAGGLVAGYLVGKPDVISRNPQKDD